MSNKRLRAPHRTASMLALQVGAILLCSGSGAAAKCVGTEYVNMQSTNVSCGQYTCQALSVCTKQQYQSTAPTLVNTLFVTFLQTLCPGNGVTTSDYGTDRACSKLPPARPRTTRKRRHSGTPARGFMWRTVSVRGRPCARLVRHAF